MFAVRLDIILWRGVIIQSRLLRRSSKLAIAMCAVGKPMAAEAGASWKRHHPDQEELALRRLPFC